jgi:hypothetical protein
MAVVISLIWDQEKGEFIDAKSFDPALDSPNVWIRSTYQRRIVWGLSSARRFLTDFSRYFVFLLAKLSRYFFSLTPGPKTCWQNMEAQNVD